VKQTFIRFDAGHQDQDNARFEAFTSRVGRVSAKHFDALIRAQVLPSLLKSAVMSSHTLIVVPSYHDFVRLRAHLRTITDLTFAAMSECVVCSLEGGPRLRPRRYSAGSDVTRARAFFKSGRKSLLVMTERFHFYRRCFVLVLAHLAR
jgi:U3 small nucleolar RNA-associated protein 25